MCEYPPATFIIKTLPLASRHCQAHTHCFSAQTCGVLRQMDVLKANKSNNNMLRTVLLLNIHCGLSYCVHQEIVGVNACQGSLNCVVPFALCFSHWKQQIMRVQPCCCPAVFEGAFPLLLWSSRHVVPSASVVSWGLGSRSAGANNALSSTSSMLVQKHSMWSVPHLTPAACSGYSLQSGVGCAWRFSVPFLFLCWKGAAGCEYILCYGSSLSDTGVRGETDIF